MIPNLKMDHLPFFTNFFKKDKNGEESSILENEDEVINLFNAFELLTISHTFLPQKLNESLTLFSNKTHPGILKKSIKLSEFVSFLDYKTPLVYWESESENLDIWNLTAQLKTNLGIELKVVWCGNSNWNNVEADLEQWFWKGYFVVLVGIDLRKDEDWSSRLGEWYRTIIEKVEDYEQSRDLKNTLNLKKGNSSFVFRYSRMHSFRNFRLIATCSRSSFISLSLDEISYKWSDENQEDAKDQFTEILENEIDEYEFERDQNFVWRRVVTNFVYMYCLIR